MTGLRCVPKLSGRSRTASSLWSRASHSLSALLPPSHNPSHFVVDLICSRIKHNQISRATPSLACPLAPIELGKESHLMPHLGAEEVSRVLLRCQSQPLPSLRFFCWAKEHLASILTPNNYCIIIHILTWSRLFHQATALLSELVTTHEEADVFECLLNATEVCNWSPAVYGMLLKVFVKKGKVRYGLQTFQRMVSLSFLPTTNDCNCLLSGLLKLSCPEKCWQVFEDMRKLGISPNTYTFNILTDVLCKGGDTGKARGFIDEMEMHGFEPDLITYNTLISGYCRKARLDDAFNLYKIMYRRGLEPDAVTYTILINGMCREGKVRDAHQLFHQMLNRGVNPSSAIFNALVTGYCLIGSTKEARKILNHMVLDGFLPDKLACYSLLEAYRNTENLSKCVNLIMYLRSLQISVTFYMTKKIIASLCKAKKPNAARNLVSLISKNGPSPDLDIYNLLIDCFCECDSIDEAFALKDEMVVRGIRPNIASYQSLISCLSRTGRTSEGEKLMWDMVASCLVPDSVICVSLIRGYCQEKSYLKAEMFLTTLIKNLHLYDIKCLNLLIETYCLEGNATKSLELQEKMLKLGLVPNRQTCRSLIYGLSSCIQGRLVE